MQTGKLVLKREKKKKKKREREKKHKATHFPPWSDPL